MTPDERGAEIASALRAQLPVNGYDLVDPALPWAEAYHESAGFTSSLIQEANNTFGLKMPSVRPTTAIGKTSNGYAMYATLADCVKDYILRQRNFEIPNTADPSVYIAQTVASGYAEDPGYAQKWRSIYDGIAGMMPLDSIDVTRASLPAWPLLLLGAALIFR